MARLWVVRGGRDGRFEETAVKENKMALGWEQVRDLGEIGNRDAILEQLKEKYPDASDRTCDRWARQLYRFVNEIRAGDTVVMPCKGKDHVFIGEVNGEYVFDPDVDLGFVHMRPVNWNKEPVPQDVFGKDLVSSFKSQGTVFEVSRNDALNRVRAVLEDGSDPGSQGSAANFDWIPFYEAVADRLLDFRYARDKLLEKIFAIKSRVNRENIPFTKLDDGTEGLLKDICPFTSIGTFTRTVKSVNRQAVAHAFAESFEIPRPWPHFPDPDTTGIPLLPGQKSLFFAFKKDRLQGDIDKLWEVFGQALNLAESDDGENRESFAMAYDEALKVKNTSWNLTMGLFWIRPRSFPTLDSKSQIYIRNTLGIEIPRNVPDGIQYLEITDSLKQRFKQKDCPVHSFPELSLAAWEKGNPSPKPEDGPAPEPVEEHRSRPTPYSADNIKDDGCFLEPSRIDGILESLRTKKNIVLQGPPGTGKTWLAKKLAFALMGIRAEDNVRSVQFHPSLSYEDFVRGWRPSGDGGLDLVDGPFLNMAETAMQSPEEKYVLVIEEINRGNPAQIFGELLTLLEADKRAEESALALSYPRHDGEKVFIPENLYVIGTMNIADRSLALVDFALRRRFAFIDLEPALNNLWFKWCHEECDFDKAVIEEIRRRIESLNERISADPNLGPQFRIGHSYVTPNPGIEDARAWFRQVAQTEIIPLLEEYWFDSAESARDAGEKLLEGDLR